MNMTVMLLDNSTYGLTKMQTSPTSPKGARSHTHPQGVQLEALNPLTVMLGISNASFIAQTLDWNPVHVYATLKAAHQHRGLSFVRVLQRCPHFTPNNWKALQEDPSRVALLTHRNGIEVAEPVRRQFGNQVEHDPADLREARALAADAEHPPIGLLHRSDSCDEYDKITSVGVGFSAADKLSRVQSEIDRFMI